jgi:HD superfamily phosphohydrolase
MSGQTEFQFGTASELVAIRSSKDIIHRDQVHGDVHYDRLSVALINTKAMQRLGRVYQLGYSHLVFRGGTHTRLSHVMGAAHMAGTIVDALRINYKQKRAARPQHVAEPIDFLPSKKSSLDSRWDVLRHLVTWAALLHDLGHVPLGHTLEDEFEGIFKKHDDFASPRSSHLWNEKSEVYSVLTNPSLYPDSFSRCQVTPTQIWQAILLICFFKDGPADSQDQGSDFVQYLVRHGKNTDTKIQSENDPIKKDDLERERDFVLLLLRAARDTKDVFRPFMTDIVANTICADYLDYVRRDPLNVGLDVLRDDRILSHFYVSTDATGLRMALALLDRHGKPRLDVCTGVVEQVRQRYRFAESIYYHKTKVSASAMFAKAMILVGKPNEIGHEQKLLFEEGTNLETVARGLIQHPKNFTEFKKGCLPSALLHPEIGDDSLHLFLLQCAMDNIERLLQTSSSRKMVGRTEELHSQLRGIALLQGITRRRLYKVGFSINASQFGQLTIGASQNSVVEARLKLALNRLRTDRKLRERVEQALADAAGWQADSILLYVPPRKNQAKGIETFAFDESGVVRLNEHHAVSEKVNELGRDYRDLWRILVLVNPAHQDSIIELSEVADVLAAELWSNFRETNADVDLHGEQSVKIMREIAWFPYIRKDHRGAAEHLRNLAIGLPTAMRIDWDLFERAPVLTTSAEDTLTSVEYAERGFLLQLLVNKHAIKEKEAIARIERKFPLSLKPIEPKSVKGIESRWLSALKAVPSYSSAQKTDLHRAFALERISDEMADTTKQQKSSGRAARRATVGDRRRRRTHNAASTSSLRFKKRQTT